MSKHTPGPWAVVTSRDVFPAVIAPNRATICIDVENDADAKLIAAAPDLLAALQEIVARNEIQHWFNLDQAHAAITAATGTQSEGE